MALIQHIVNRRSGSNDGKSELTVISLIMHLKLKRIIHRGPSLPNLFNGEIREVLGCGCVALNFHPPFGVLCVPAVCWWH